MILSFFAPGTPAPQGSKRHVGRGRMIESSKALPAWRDTVAWSARHAMGSRPTILGPVGVTVEFWFPMPKSARRADREKGKVLRPRKPDVDKLSRAVLDALTDAGVIADDSQVVVLTATKWDVTAYPGAHVVVSDV